MDLARKTDGVGHHQANKVTLPLILNTTRTRRRVLRIYDVSTTETLAAGTPHHLHTKGRNED